MILLLSLSPLGQAGAKRLHPTLRRIRQHELRSGAFASLNKNDFNLYLVFTAPPFSKRRRLRTSCLKSKPMDHRGNFNSQQLAAARKGKCAVSTATAVYEFPNAEPQSPCSFVFKERSTSEAPARNREWWIHCERNSIYFTGTLGTEPIPEVFDERPIEPVFALHEPRFSRVARQPREPVLQALKKILRSA
jgi:hypothetical protein